MEQELTNAKALIAQLKAENENLKNEIWKERENTCFAEEAIEFLKMELEELKSHISTPSPATLPASDDSGRRFNSSSVNI
jgi:FtsZ-binding cell division protein ZapB